jgi:quercetin dioxygenase-like cupin family protein
MTHFDWSQIPQEQLNPRFSRKFVNGEKIMIAQLFLLKGCLVPEHSHESEQLSMVVAGNVKFKLDGEERIVTSNQMVLIPSNKVHSVEALEDTLVYDIFSPIRLDWLDKTDSYLRK